MVMDVTTLKNIAGQSELNKRGKVLARIGEANVCVSRFSQHPKWEIHPKGEEVLIGISGELSVVILDPSGPRTIVVKSGDVAVVPENTWHSPVPHGEVSVLSMGDYAGTIVSNNDDPRQ
ncbi:putative Cupin 2 domain-containing protein [Nitrospira japonica]|uniref:Putative Cupin 2 domain-containing protein n=2 Tax=Nitrospira japonica TaxID=1325564 RepID=A0A1W1I736_9BACT|nr:putative Cupin 2 domain-containing protein [Nitrospira japonica]